MRLSFRAKPNSLRSLTRRSSCRTPRHRRLRAPRIFNTTKVTITPSANGKAKISAQFSKLRPSASYSLFENHFDQQPVGFTPLDGAGKDNNFHSDKKGVARVTLTAPQMLTHANAVLLVYHSDKTFHGEQRGEIGVTAHHQLIARIPE